MTPERLEAITARANAATKGPWNHDPNSAWRIYGCEQAHEYVWADSEGDEFPCVAMTGIKGQHPRSPRDAEFIAHARTDVPELVAEVERLSQAETEWAAYRKALVELHEFDELVFGGFICPRCTDSEDDDPVPWPCDSLRAIGVTDDDARQIILAYRAAIKAGR